MLKFVYVYAERARVALDATCAYYFTYMAFVYFMARYMVV